MTNTRAHSSRRTRNVAAFMAGLLGATIAVVTVQTAQLSAAPGDLDATFVPITPCRLIDTRPAPDRVGPFALFGADDTRGVAAHGTNGDCTIPTDAVGLSLNVTAVGATAPTFLTIWPGGPRPVASSLNPFSDEPPTPNAVATELSSTGSFDLYNLAGAVDVIVDVNGYYTSATLQELAAALTAVEARLGALESWPTRLPDWIGSAASQPFVVDSEPLNTVTIGKMASAVSVTVTAPADGRVAVVASGYLSETTVGTTVVCGASDAPNELPTEFQNIWKAPVTASFSHLSVSRVFDVVAGQTSTYHLVCFNGNNDTSTLGAPQLMATFTPAP